MSSQAEAHMGAGHVLTLNAGSSSLKFALFECDGALASPVASGLADGLGLAQGATLTLRGVDAERLPQQALGAGRPGASHADALDAVLGWLRTLPGVQVRVVGHRIVHGGTAFDAAVRVDDAVLAAIAALAPLAPLHQPHNLAGVHAACQAFGDVPQVACFDTAFHRSQPELNQRFALPQALHDRGIRRYGFHGLSYESIRDQLAHHAPALLKQRVVLAHLGNGASMCALQQGRSIATTMSFSPLDGLPMGTRCGRLDPAVVLHLLQHEGMDAEQVLRLLSRESGLLGLSGVSSDLREILASPSAAAALAVDYLVEQVLRELASMAASLRGLDALVFTGGIGENAVTLRERIVDGAAWMGLHLDPAANRHAPGCISDPASRVQVHVMQTNEESVIARHAVRLALGPDQTLRC